MKIAYRNVIEVGRHPIVALYLTLPPEELDVNVHPAKTELRFRDAAAVRALVIGGVQRALAAPAGSASPTVMMFTRPSTRPNVSLRPAATQTRLSAFAEPRLAFNAGPAARTWQAPEADPDHPLGAPLAQLLDTYVIAVASDDSLVLIDQHAAHERLTHEALRTQLLEGAVRSQPLLLPIVVDLARHEAVALLARTETLERLGLELEAFGPGAVMLRAFPAVLVAAGRPPDAVALLRDLAEQFAELGEATALDTVLDAAIARLACHGSIRAGRRLTTTRDGRAVASDGSHSPGGHVQSWPAYVPEIIASRPGENVRSPLAPALLYSSQPADVSLRPAKIWKHPAKYAQNSRVLLRRQGLAPVADNTAAEK